MNYTVLDVTDRGKPASLPQTKLPHAYVRSNSLAIRGDTMMVAYWVSRVGRRPGGIDVFDLAIGTRIR